MKTESAHPSEILFQVLFRFQHVLLTDLFCLHGVLWFSMNANEVENLVLCQGEAVRKQQCQYLGQTPFLFYPFFPFENLLLCYKKCNGLLLSSAMYHLCIQLITPVCSFELYREYCCLVSDVADVADALNMPFS